MCISHPGGKLLEVPEEVPVEVPVEVLEVQEVLVPVVQELCKTPKNLFPILHSRYP